jgi:hypothetical protein
LGVKDIDADKRRMDELAERRGARLGDGPALMLPAPNRFGFQR